MASIIYVGLDVHQQSISACLLLPETEQPLYNEVANERDRLQRAVKKWSQHGELRVCYEASSAGYVIKRWLDGWGVPCEVIAPSLVPKSPGERVKTDRRDAFKLARLYRAGLLQVVRVPSEEDETVRAVVRLREALTRDMTRCKNRALKYLSTLGLRYNAGSYWTKKHRTWLHQLALTPDQRLVLQGHLDALDELAARAQRIEARIAEIAQEPRYAPAVGALLSLRGVGLFTAMVLLSEIGDVRRFGEAAQLMSYVGLVPGEHSSGETQQRGRITKMGSQRVRWVLVQAAWNQLRKPGNCQRLRSHWQSQPPEVVRIARKAEQRLHQRFWRLTLRCDRKTAAVAVARELVGFVWAILQVVA